MASLFYERALWMYGLVIFDIVRTWHSIVNDPTKRHKIMWNEKLSREKSTYPCHRYLLLTSVSIIVKCEEHFNQARKNVSSIKYQVWKRHLCMLRCYTNWNRVWCGIVTLIRASMVNEKWQTTRPDKYECLNTQLKYGFKQNSVDHKSVLAMPYISLHLIGPGRWGSKFEKVCLKQLQTFNTAW